MSDKNEKSEAKRKRPKTLAERWAAEANAGLGPTPIKKDDKQPK